MCKRFDFVNEQQKSPGLLQTKPQPGLPFCTYVIRDKKMILPDIKLEKAADAEWICEALNLQDLLAH